MHASQVKTGFEVGKLTKYYQKGWWSRLEGSRFHREGSMSACKRSGLSHRGYEPILYAGYK